MLLHGGQAALCMDVNTAVKARTGADTAPRWQLIMPIYEMVLTLGRLGRPRLQVPASDGRMNGFVSGMNGRAPSGSYGSVNFSLLVSKPALAGDMGHAQLVRPCAAMRQVAAV